MASVSIADLTISIKDNSKQAAEKVLSLASALEQLRSKQDGGSALKTVASDIATLKSADMGGLIRLRKQLASATTYAERLATAMDKVVKASSVKLSKGATQAITQSQQVADSAQMTTSTGETLTDSVSGAKETSRTFSEIGKNIGLAMGRVKNAIVGVGQAGVRVFQNLLPQGMISTLKQLGRLMKMRILRTIVKSLLAGFTEGLQNCYYWAKATGDQFASSMDTISTSMNYAKNSIGAAFSNIINIIAPVIDQVVDWLVVGINYINMFFAALSGATEYTRAKKVAVEYGKAAQGAIGGAAGAAKELKEQLSVLDFDELHQLQEQQDPSSGGGGGGGGGTPGANYADMFEKAKIDKWMTDNFDHILDVVKAIAAGILAWKLSDAFSNSIKQLTGMQKLGFALTITGIVLDYEGSYGLGYNGMNATDLVKTLIGSALQITGISMMTGSIAAGFAIGIPLSLVVSVIGYVNGVKAKFKEDLERNPDYQMALKELDEAVAIHKAYMDVQLEVTNIELNYRKDMFKADQGQKLIDEIKKYDGLTISPDVDLDELQSLVDQFNALGFDDIIASWDIVNGKIETNVEDLQAAIDKFKEYATVTALQDLYTQLAVAQAEQGTAQGERDYAQAQYDDLLEQVRALAPELLYNMNNELGNGAGWQPGEKPSDEIQIKGNEEVLQLLEQAEVWYESLSELDAVIGDKEGVVSHIQALIDEILGLGDASSSTAQKLNPQAVMPYAPTSYDKITGTVPQYALGSSRYDLQKQYEQIVNNSGGGLNIFADPTKNAKGYTGALDGVAEATAQAKEQSEQYNVASNDMFRSFGGGVKTFDTYSQHVTNAGTTTKNTSSAIVTALTGIQKGVDMGVMGKAMASKFTNEFSSVGGNVKAAIEKDMNNIGGGMKYTDIMGNINTGLSKAQANTPFSNIGVSIGGNIQSGSTSGFNSGTVMTSYKTGLTNNQKNGGFSSIGSLMGGDMQSGAYNGFSSKYIISSYLSGLTDKQKNASFSGVGGAMGGDMQNGAWNGFSSKYIIGAYLQGLLDAEYNASFSSIGKAIGADIKNGIAAAIKTINFSTTAVVAGVKRTVSGSGDTTLWASGGYPEAGSVFIAGEAGAEAVGTINGRTGVANRDQIASAIAMALQPMLSGGYGTTTTNVMLNMDSRTVARASLKGQRAMNRQYNLVANA